MQSRKENLKVFRTVRENVKIAKTRMKSNLRHARCPIEEINPDMERESMVVRRGSKGHKKSVDAHKIYRAFDTVILHLSFIGVILHQLITSLLATRPRSVIKVDVLYLLDAYEMLIAFGYRSEHPETPQYQP